MARQKRILLLGVFLVVLDQASKALAVLFLPSTVLVLHQKQIRGAEDVLAIAATLTVLVFFSLWLLLSLRKEAPPETLRFQPGLTFLIAGLASNLADVFFRFGGVVNFAVMQTLACNVADGEILVGGLLLVWAFFVKGEKK